MLLTIVRDHLHATQWVLLSRGTYLKMQLNTLVSPVSLCGDRKNKEFSRSFLFLKNASIIMQGLIQ